MMRQSEENRFVLLVEDSPDDVLFFRRAWKKAGMGDFRNVEDGEAAVAYLEGSGDYRDRVRFPLPSLVVLDLKLPRRSGLDVLAWIRETPRFRQLPVVVLTSSREPNDVARAHALGVVAYHVKPVDSRELDRIVGAIAGVLDAQDGQADEAGPGGREESRQTRRPGGS